MRGINYHLKFYVITIVDSDWLTFSSKQKHKALSNGAEKGYLGNINKLCMVIYANTHHNSDEEFQLTPMEGSWTSQGFYGTEITLLHLRGCGFPYKLAMERPSVAISPQTICVRTIEGCLLNAVSFGSSIDLSNHEPLDRGLRIFILINIPASAPFPGSFYAQWISPFCRSWPPGSTPPTSGLCTQLLTLLLCELAKSPHLF